MTTLTTARPSHRLDRPNSAEPLFKFAPITHGRPAFQTGLRKCPLAALHTSNDLYIKHLERHFANDAALEALRFALPTLSACTEFANAKALIRAVRGGATHASSDAVRSVYAQAAECTIREAIRLNWIVEPSPSVTIAFASTGLLAVIERGILRTLFFPGLSENDADDGTIDGASADARAAIRREHAWTAEERHFYRVFRPAVQVIRSQPDDAVAGRVSQYGALKRVMPRASGLRIANWLSFRAVDSYEFKGEKHARA